MSVIMLTNDTDEAKVIVQCIEEIIELENVFIEMKTKNIIQFQFRKLIGTSKFYKYKSLFQAIRSKKSLKFFL